MTFPFTPTPHVDPSGWTSPRTALEVDPQPRSIPPVSARPAPLLTRETLAKMLPRSRRAAIIGTAPLIPAEPKRPVMGYNTIAPKDGDFLTWLLGPTGAEANDPATCICEQDENCLLLYRAYEYGFELSDAVMEWLPAAVEAVEAQCYAKMHYTSIADAEALAADVTLDVDDAPLAAHEFWTLVDDDHTQYLARTEDGGRWSDALDGGLAIDRDREDYTTLIRSREMAKRRELFEAVTAAGLPMAQVVPWVKSRIATKRLDAIREKREAEKKSLYTESMPLPSESQIRLRAYASCLTAIQHRGAETSLRTFEPVVTTPYRDPRQHTGLSSKQRQSLRRRRQAFLAAA